MKTNRSFDAEARDFWDAIPQDIRKNVTWKLRHDKLIAFIKLKMLFEAKFACI